MTTRKRTGVFSEEGCDSIAVSKEQRLDMKGHHEAMVKMETSERAKYWFRRPAYAGFDLRRGDAGGQEIIKSVSDIGEGNTKNK